MLSYSAARVGLFAVCGVLAWVAGLTGIAWLAVALLTSGVLSWFLLQRQRLAMGAAVERAVENVRTRVDRSAAAEDGYVDAMPPSRTSDG